VKSCIRQIPPSDVFVNNQAWCKLLLDSEEMAKAIRQDDVRGLVRRVVLDHYPNLATAQVLVDELTRSVLDGVAATVLNRTSRASLSVVFDENGVLEIERKAKEREECSPSKGALYWVGEGRPVQ
jgi:hypothetical protein